MERLNLLRSQLVSSKLANNDNTVSITDNRTGNNNLNKARIISSLLLMEFSKLLMLNQLRILMENHLDYTTLLL